VPGVLLDVQLLQPLLLLLTTAVNATTTAYRLHVAKAGDRLGTGWMLLLLLLLLSIVIIITIIIVIIIIITTIIIIIIIIIN
jgi:hypothetical protein